jgi:hypothetical protein
LRSREFRSQELQELQELQEFGMQEPVVGKNKFYGLNRAKQ